MGQARTSLHCGLRRPHDPLTEVSEEARVYPILRRASAK